MPNRILNVLKDIFDPRDHVVVQDKITQPLKISFRSKVPYIKDQGSLGSCTGHAGTEHLELLYRTQKSNLPLSIDRSALRFSPLFLYGQERMIDGTFNEDEGSYPRTLFKVLQTIGCCLEKDDAYNVNNVFQAITESETKEAGQFKIGSYHRILDVETAKTVLQSGYSFTVGTPLYSQFEGDEAAETGLIAMPTGTSIGGHEVHCIGCNDSKNVLGQIGAFEIQNSWGTGWGSDGYCWIPYAYFDKLISEVDFWVGHFGPKWIPKTGIPNNIL